MARNRWIEFRVVVQRHEPGTALTSSNVPWKEKICTSGHLPRMGDGLSLVVGDMQHVGRVESVLHPCGSSDASGIPFLPIIYVEGSYEFEDAIANDRKWKDVLM